MVYAAGQRRRAVGDGSGHGHALRVCCMRVCAAKRGCNGVEWLFVCLDRDDDVRSPRALYEADATKNASRANIVDDRGLNMLKNIQENNEPLSVKWAPHFFDFSSIFTSNISSFSMIISAPDCVINILGISYPSSDALILSGIDSGFFNCSSSVNISVMGIMFDSFISEITI